MVDREVCFSSCPVVIVDDHELFSASLTAVLREHGLAARQVSVADLPAFAGEPCPEQIGLVVLDLYLGKDANGQGILGYQWVLRLCDRGWTVLLVTGSDDELAVAAAIAGGAAGLVHKTSPFHVLLSVVVRAAAGEQVMSDDERAEWIAVHKAHQERRDDVAAKLALLSSRERQVLDLIAEGEDATAIAKRLMVSVPTVRAQIRSIFVKLQVNNQLKAAALVRPARPNHESGGR